MRTNDFKDTLKAAVRVGGILLFGGVLAWGQQQVNLTAGPASITVPDGTVVPMWGYTCDATQPAGSTATCAKLNPAAPAATTTTPAGWSPVVITVPTGQGLTINLTNNLSFTPIPLAAPGTNTVPTSLVIVGQLGGGLGTTATSTPSPNHATQSSTWPIAGNGATNTPPAQGPRVQSFSTEVLPGAATPTPLTWAAATLRPGTYLIESGTHPSIQGPMGLYGILVVTTAPGAAAGCAYPGATATAACAVSYNADVPLLLSEIDPVQNNAVQTAVTTSGFSETAVWSGQPGGCGNPSSATYNTCYPPAVNYSPLYYLFNGVAFDKTHASASLFSPVAAVPPGTGSVLVRLVNAGLRMHVPSIVGSQTGGSSTTPAVAGFSLIAEDGNVLPGVPRVQSEVFMAAGKTYDVMVNGPPAGAPALPVFDRQLSLSGNATSRDAGMLAYIGLNTGPGSGAIPSAPSFAAAVANPDTYNSVVSCTVAPCHAVTVSDPSKGVIANDVNVYGVQLLTAPAGGTLSLNANGTFTYVPNAGTASDSFTYCANGSVTGTTCSSGLTATVTLGAATLEAGSGITCPNSAFSPTVATSVSIKPPGILWGCKDAAGYPLTVNNPASVTGAGFTRLSVDKNGGFNATVPGAGTYTFTFNAQNSQGTVSGAAASVTLTFPAASGLNVTVLDGQDKRTVISDYRWIIEEDKTFYNNPNCTTNTGTTPNPNCTTYNGVPPTFGVNFHTSSMPYVAQGCTGPLSCELGQTIYDPASQTHVPAVCDVGNGVCRTGASQKTAVLPSQVALNPAKRYYISVLPGDAANPFNTANANSGHGMGGAPILFPQPNTAVMVLVQPNPFPTGKLSVVVFEDDFPLNGEQDAGGGVDVLSPQEPGLGGFNIVLMDVNSSTGDATGQDTYDMFNEPLSNSLAGTIDPISGFDACPIAQQATNDPTQKGIIGMIVTCPKYEADGKTLSPLAGQAVIANLNPDRFSVIATPGADRIARGEEWLQTNTLDGQKGHDAFIRAGEPSYFQEFGPAGYHVSIGFANPAIINARKAGVCAGTDVNLQGTNCTNSVTGVVTAARVSRTPDERIYSSGSRDNFFFTQCYVSLGDPDGEDFAFTKCDDHGQFTLTGLPDGNWRITIFDQWNDQIVDGLSTPVTLSGGKAVNMGDIPVQQWQANIYTRTFIDDNKDGVSQASEAGIPLINTTVRFRNGSMSNILGTDFSGIANFNETFPLFNWYVVETDTTRYKNTGTHVVYDAGGPADGSPSCGQTGVPACGTSTIGKFLANTAEKVSVPANLRVPGAVYCANADCAGYSIANGPGTSAPPTSGTTYLSTGRIDPPWVGVEGWQGFPGQNSFIEFGKTPFVPGENGGIKGHVVYASTRPFDDPWMLVQVPWDPLVANVTMNLYQEGTAPDGSQSLTLVDTTQTSSWDKWAQGFQADGVTPNMNCPGQSTSDLFIFTLQGQPNYLNAYDAQYNGGTATPLPNNSQFKCYDGMHNWNQVQPAPYDGMYKFPSVTAVDSAGKPTLTGTNCTICTANPTDATPMLPTGKYVVEVVLPPGYELVKEEDKNILIGDNFIAPSPVQFGGNFGLGSIFILPDQAQVAANYNANNAQNPTKALGATPENQIVPGFVPEPVWPCVGQARIVPDYMSIFPQSLEVAPFAGATRNLCDRKEVTLGDQSSAIAKFYIFTSAHIASHFTGLITDDFTSEFDPFSPAFGEKFSPPNMPVSIKDFAFNEVSRVYSDQWGAFNGLTYSTWDFNPPNITGVAPQMSIFCMNDPGPILDTRTGSPTLGQMITDPLYNPSYSQFCYELPFMPGSNQALDTPVVPTSAFAGSGYNNVDCNYPDATPAISEVDGDGIGPWVSAAGHTIKIYALGDQLVNNYGYSGPAAKTAPFNQKTVTRHYGFGPAPAGGCSNGNASAACPNVTVGGIPLHGVTWTDTMITGAVQANVPACAVQQQAQYGGTAAKCGELVITAANGKQSIDTVTVTIGGKLPTHVPASFTIQSAIDGASPGDLIILDPTTPATSTTPAVTATHNELLLMWKPVRLQGVGAASSRINANAHPAGVLDPWRRQVVCLFGIAINGSPISSTNVYDPAGTFTCTSAMQFAVDRLEREATVGWDASLNGNLAEQLQEPTLMGAYEGAGITVLAKGVKFPAGSNPFAAPAGGEPGTFPTGTAFLTNADCTSGPNGTNPYPSSFWCNPSRIDGLSITNSSQGGGGIFAHAYAHNLEIANDRVYNNHGTTAGGIAIGQGEFNPQNIQGALSLNATGSCQTTGFQTGQAQPYCYDMFVNVHNNSITSNYAIGDELFSATLAGAGGITFCTGADYYKFQSNWLCGNMSTGDGGGLAHLGFIWNGDIEHNAILFNESLNPTIPTQGGGIMIMGAPDTDPVCSQAPDQDCPPGTSDGTGPGLVINGNLIMGNAAESGSGGGMRFQGVNGTEVATFPTQPQYWYKVDVTNNIIANNVAGWDGAGLSFEDALAVNLINNTIVSNDTTASSGVLFQTLGAPLASSQSPPGSTNNGTSSLPQPAGLVTMRHSPNLRATLAASAPINCPAGHPHCDQVSYPLLANNVFWQNRSFYVGVGALSPQYQQNIVTLYNAFSGTPAASQTATGQCTAASYWDIGVRGDTGPANHGSGFTLAPRYSVLTDASDYPGANNTGSNPAVVSQYCNGSRVPPENGGMGYQVPPGISDAVVPNPVFTLTPAATVDEGNNWINMTWGPLSLTNPSIQGSTGNWGGGPPLGNYALTAGSPANNYIPVNSTNLPVATVPTLSADFFGNPRPDAGNPNRIDVGAVEFQAAVPAPTLTSIAPSSGAQGTNVPVTLTGTNLTGTTAVTVSGTLVTVSGLTVVNATTITATFSIGSTALLGARTVSVTTPGGTSNTVTFTVNALTPAPTLTSIVPASGARGTLVLPVTLTGTNLTGATAVNVSATGITVSGLTVVNATTIRANFSISGTATQVAHTVSVTTPGGTSNTVTFTVPTASAGTLSFTSATNGVLGTFLGIRTLTFTIPAPRAPVTSVITVTNTGAAPLQITEEALTINIGGLYSVTGNTCSFATPLAPLAACTVSVRYATPAAQPPLPDLGALGVINLGTTPNGVLVLSAR